MAINSNIKAGTPLSRNVVEPDPATAPTRTAAPSSMGLKKADAEDSDVLAVSASFQAKLKSLDQLRAQPPQEEPPAVDGELLRMGDMLARMKALSVQAKTVPLAPGQIELLNSEFDQLKSEIQRFSNATQRKGVSIPYDPSNDNSAAQVEEDQPSPWVASLQIESQASVESAIEDVNYTARQVSQRKNTLNSIQDRLTTAFTAIASHNPRSDADQSKIQDPTQAQALAQQIGSSLRQSATSAYSAQTNQHPKVALSLLR